MTSTLVTLMQPQSAVRVLVSDAGSNSEASILMALTTSQQFLLAKRFVKRCRYDADLLSLPTDTHVVAIEVEIPADLNRDALSAVRIHQVKDFSS